MTSIGLAGSCAIARIFLSHGEILRTPIPTWRGATQEISLNAIARRSNAKRVLIYHCRLQFLEERSLAALPCPAVEWCAELRWFVLVFCVSSLNSFW